MFKEVIALEESMSGDIRNVIIIGSGPAGYTAGLYTSSNARTAYVCRLHVRWSIDAYQRY